MEQTFLQFVTILGMPSTPREDSIFNTLPGVLNQLEQDEHLALLAPTYRHSKESTGPLFVRPLEAEILRRFA